MKITYAKLPEDIAYNIKEEDILKEGKDYVYPLRLYGQKDFTFSSPVKIKLGQNAAAAKKELHKFVKALIHAELMTPHLEVGVMFSEREKVCYIAKTFSDNWCDLRDFTIKPFEKIKDEIKTLRPC